jgi:xylose isomerase
MKTVLEQGGIAPGGFNFDAKVRRESTSLEDMFIAHILGMVSGSYTSWVRFFYSSIFFKNSFSLFKI